MWMWRWYFRNLPYSLVYRMLCSSPNQMWEPHKPQSWNFCQRSCVLLILIRCYVLSYHSLSGDISLTLSYCILSLSPFSLQVIGNGSFGVVYQARLIDSQEMVAIKKVLQDKRFKVRLMLNMFWADDMVQFVWFPQPRSCLCRIESYRSWGNLITATLSGYATSSTPVEKKYFISLVHIINAWKQKRGYSDSVKRNTQF